MPESLPESLSDPAPQPLVLDTNVVLDLLVFHDPSTLALARGLATQRYRWLVTQAMCEELERVMYYPKIARCLAAKSLDAQQILTESRALCQLRPDPVSAPLRCGDPDDQKFIDLALAERALLLSKDLQVLRLRKGLAERGIQVWARLPMN